MGGMLEQAAISGQKSGSCKSEHLPQGEIPGHYGEDQAERLKGYVALARLCLSDPLGERFAHLLGHQHHQFRGPIPGDLCCLASILSLAEKNRCSSTPEKTDLRMQRFL